LNGFASEKFLNFSPRTYDFANHRHPHPTHFGSPAGFSGPSDPSPLRGEGSQPTVAAAASGTAETFHLQSPFRTHNFGVRPGRDFHSKPNELDSNAAHE
jgi:hypothetical protein